MNIIKNDKLIKRNGRIGQWSSLVGLVVLAAGMYISFKEPGLFAYSLAALFVGFTLTQISMYFGNRYGRSPRPDEKLDAGLKGLPGDFVIYHYMTPVPHLLIGPAGVWILMPFHQRGQIYYRNNRWRMSGGGFMQNYLRIFGQEGLGRPELEAEHQIQLIRKHIQSLLPDTGTVEIEALMVFTDPDVEVASEGSPLQALKIKQLKEFMRQKAKEKKLGAQEEKQLLDALGKP